MSVDDELAGVGAGLPGQVAAVQVDGVAAVLREQAHGGVAALADLAVHDDPACGQFVEAVAQLVERDAHRAGDGSWRATG